MAEPDSREGRGARVMTWLVATGTLLGTSLLAFRRKPVLDPYSEDTGRGSPSTPPSAKAKSLNFEPHDASPRDVTLVMLGHLAVAGTVVGLMFVMLGFFHDTRVANTPRFTPEERARIEPPGPHVQAHPHQDLYARQAYEEAQLNSYVWLDPDHARARIPIARAMALAVGRSLDAGPEPVLANQAGQAGANRPGTNQAGTQR